MGTITKFFLNIGGPVERPTLGVGEHCGLAVRISLRLTLFSDAFVK